VPFDEFRKWQSTRQRYFDGLAFYQSRREKVVLNNGAQLPMQVARASANLFAVLGVPVLGSPALTVSGTQGPEAVLSYRTWVREFDASPDIVGRVVHIGAQTARIAGVTPSSSLSLPADPDLWLLGASNGEGSGYVIAHMSTAGQRMFELAGDRLPISVEGGDPDEPGLVGLALSDQAIGPNSIAYFALFLALLALPAVVSVSLSEPSYSAYRPCWQRQCVRWLFLAAQLVLVSATAYCVSLILGYAFVNSYSASAELVQLASCFLLNLFGLRWALLDQRHRCPVCLRHVTHPASVGLASQTFLGWNGTEMFCAGGHSLLHVPALPTSWFHAPRWIYLDPSWQSLFDI
jgi:hypothetical protein